jgi:integrase
MAFTLEWSDVDLRRGQLTIERSEWKSEVTATKRMKVRVVPMTQRLQKASGYSKGRWRA